MKTYLYIIAFTVSYADLSGIPAYIRKRIGVRSMKPFDCSYCLTFWITLAYNYKLLKLDSIWQISFNQAFETIGLSLLVAICSQLVLGIIKKLI